MSLKKYSFLLLPCFLLVIGLYLVPLKIYGPDLSNIPGDLGDARFNNFILEHDYQYFTGKQAHYWDAPFMYPFKNVIAFSDNLLGSAPIYVAFRAVNFDRETSFQLWLLTLFMLNFCCCYYALFKWSGDNSLSATGAYIFAFSIMLVGNIYNAQTFPRFMVPLIFYWCWKYVQDKKIIYFSGISLGIVFQFYCGMYLGFLLLYSLILFLVAYFIVYRDFSVFRQFKNRSILRNHLIVTILSLLVFYPLIQPYIEISKFVPKPYFNDVLQTIPTLRSYFFTSKAAVLWTCLSEHGMTINSWWCHFLFVGALPWISILLLPIVLWKKKLDDTGAKKFIGFLFISFFIGFMICLNINEFTLYKRVYELPGFSSMRSVNRIINTEIFLFILILVFVFKQLKASNKLLKVLITSLPVLVIFDNLIDASEIKTYNKKEGQHRIEVVKNELKVYDNKKYKAIAFMPDSTENRNMVALHLDVMLASQELYIPCVNAYSGHNPGEYNGFFVKTNRTYLEEWCNYNQIDISTIQQIKPMAPINF